VSGGGGKGGILRVRGSENRITHPQQNPNPHNYRIDNDVDDAGGKGVKIGASVVSRAGGKECCK